MLKAKSNLHTIMVLIAVTSLLLGLVPSAWFIFNNPHQLMATGVFAGVFSGFFLLLMIFMRLINDMFDFKKPVNLFLTYALIIHFVGDFILLMIFLFGFSKTISSCLIFMSTILFKLGLTSLMLQYFIAPFKKSSYNQKEEEPLSFSRDRNNIEHNSIKILTNLEQTKAINRTQITDKKGNLYMCRPAFSSVAAKEFFEEYKDMIYSAHTANLHSFMGITNQYCVPLKLDVSESKNFFIINSAFALLENRGIKKIRSVRSDYNAYSILCYDRNKMKFKIAETDFLENNREAYLSCFIWSTIWDILECLKHMEKKYRTTSGNLILSYNLENKNIKLTMADIKSKENFQTVSLEDLDEMEEILGDQFTQEFASRVSACLLSQTEVADYSLSFDGIN